MSALAPGFHAGVAMREYLAMPAVSASLLYTLDERCARAAWHDSWLNPKPAAETSEDAQNVGTIAHGILLEGSTANVAVIDPRDHPAEKTLAIPVGWTNKSIKAARAAAIAEGKTPILAPDMKIVVAMVDAAREYLESLRSAPPEDLARSVWSLFQAGAGESELTGVWEEDGVVCRFRPSTSS